MADILIDNVLSIAAGLFADYRAAFTLYLNPPAVAVRPPLPVVTQTYFIQNHIQADF